MPPIKCSVCGDEVGVDEVVALTFDRRGRPPVFLRLCQTCFVHKANMVEWLEDKAFEAPSRTSLLIAGKMQEFAPVVQRRSGATTFGTARTTRGHDTINGIDAVL